MIFIYLCGSIFAHPALYSQNILGTTVNIEDFRLARECAGGDERAMKELYSKLEKMEVYDDATDGNN